MTQQLTPSTTEAGIGSDPERAGSTGSKCGEKCGMKCGIRFRTSGRPRPRQHRVFASSPSPTTRPPRRNERKEVRVVGLGTKSNPEQTGAGPDRNPEASSKSTVQNNKNKDQKQNNNDIISSNDLNSIDGRDRDGARRAGGRETSAVEDRGGVDERNRVRR
jgi:hypothetical protein